MLDNDPKTYCFLIRNSQTCVKTKVAKKHLPYYECEKCIWRIKSEDIRHLNSLKKIYEKYGKKKWS